MSANNLSTINWSDSAYIITEDQAKIQSLEQRVQDLEDARWKQSSLLAMTQLIAVIALSVAVLALIIT